MATFTPVLPRGTGKEQSDPIDIEDGQVHNLLFSGTGEIGIYAVGENGKPELLGDFSPEDKSGRLFGPIKYVAIRHDVETPSGIGYFASE